ncbi:transcription elongation factor B polypeptide 3 [Galendromus occidentalis]|uniref:Transcription elongation factor B polypeptide 3 n=1 Tax=Galendromus occidentalis TaxID=34638 RepID=A0AAJ7WH27_9ACAR|nr:transcription elongation factor B polypeptide 3 [Galendromus occidentalis]
MSVDKIKEYCRRLEKHSEDRAVLKDTLYKLNKMEVTVDILQKTGIGKVVNGIKHRGGKTGDMAADLIKKWRNVVDREAEQEHEEDNNNNSNGSSHHKSEVKKESHHNHHHRESKKHKESSSSSHRRIEKVTKDRSGGKVEEPALFSDLSVVNKKASTKPKKQEASNSKSSHKKPSDHHDDARHHKSKKSEKKETSLPSPASSSSSDSGSESQPVEPPNPTPESKKTPADSTRAPQATKRKAPEEFPVDGGMGANFGSFEECLGTIEPKNLKKKRRLKTSSSPKMTVTSSTLNGSSGQPKGPRLPDLVDKKMIESRPAVDYKPLPRIEPKAPVVAAKRPIDEAAQFTSSRRDRTAIYSGRRNVTLTSVPSLFDACIRVLMDHVDCIEETGGVPYDILKPVLERCNGQQLYRLEYFNPYLSEDTDALWEAHCRKDFRSKTRQPGEESWKELYLRCHDEREQKLRSLTASISQSMREKQAPVRTTKLAYVDSMAKAPLNVQRAQLKNGTFVGNKAQPSQARKIASHAAAAAATEPVRAPASAAPKKPKLAPLMAKTLSFLKMRRSTGYGFASR